MRASRAAVAGGILVAALAAGCDLRGFETGVPERVELYDLGERLPLATVTRETGGFLFDRAAAGAHLLDGWLEPESDAQGRSFRWATGEVSRLRLVLAGARDLEIEFDARPFTWTGAPNQTASLAFNEQPAGKVELTPGLHSYTVPVPAETVRIGENLIEVRHGYSRAPAEVGTGTDRRTLAAAWYALRVVRTGADPGREAPGDRRGQGTIDASGLQAASVAGEPVYEAESGQLRLPYGSRLDYYLLLPDDALLTAASWGQERQGGAVHVTLTVDGGAETTVAQLEASRGAADVVLPGSAGRPARLSLAAVGSAGPDPVAGAWLLSPRLVGRADTQQAAPRPAVSPSTGDAAHDRGAPGPDAAPAAAVAVGSETTSQAPERPSIVIYLIDTLRADRLGCYGHPGGLTPQIDAFAGRALLFEDAVASSSRTRPTVATLFTGLWPAAHGANREHERLSDSALTLAELLSAAGYRTAAFVTNPTVGESFGFAQGFDHFDYVGERSQRAPVLHRAALEWLDRERPEQPLLLYLHSLEPHTPYAPPPSFRQRLAGHVADATRVGSDQFLRELSQGLVEPRAGLTEDLVALYEAEVAAADAAFGRMLAHLEARGLGDAALLLLSDHGEEFADHGGWTHGKTLFAEVLQVPMILRLPGQQEGRRVPGLARQLDVLPTLLDLAGVPAPAGLEGRSLLPPAAATDPPHPTRAYAYLHYQGPPRLAVIDGGWKYVERPVQDGTIRWLFDRRRDPTERHNLAAERPILAGYLATLLQERLRAAETRLDVEEVEIDTETARRLRALGYLE